MLLYGQLLRKSCMKKERCVMEGGLDGKMV